jgi:hypothetical protein
MLKKVLVLMSLVPVAALATLIGDTVSVRYVLGVSTTTDSVLVGTGVEIACPSEPSQNICTLLTVAGQSVDIGARTIRYENASNDGAFTTVTPNGFRFEDLDTDAIVRVTLDTNIEDLNLFRVSYTNDSIEVEMGGLSIEAGSYFEVGMGFLGLAGVLRKAWKSS